MPVAIRGLGFLADLSVWSEGLNYNFKVLARALGFLSAVMVSRRESIIVLSRLAVFLGGRFRRKSTCF